MGGTFGLGYTLGLGVTFGLGYTFRLGGTFEVDIFSRAGLIFSYSTRTFHYIEC